MYEEIYYILAGLGSTEVVAADGKTQRLAGGREICLGFR